MGTVPGFGPPEDESFGPPEEPKMQSTSPIEARGGIVPEFHPERVMPFAKQVGSAAGKDISTAWEGIKSGGKEALDQLKEDPSRIVPMWFGGIMKGMEAGAQAVATSGKYAFQGDIPEALSSAAGGDPTKAQEYRDQGNSGGEFWEMLGKPLALLATGKALGAVGGSVLEGSELSRLRVMRSVMSDASSGRAISMEEAQLAHEAMRDAAAQDFGTGPAASKRMKKAMPSREKGIREILSGNPSTKSGVESGNKSLIDLSRKAVEIAGEPADEVNRVYGYMPGQQVAQSIKSSLIQQAADAESKGLGSYAKALKERAASMDGKKTLGEIFAVKKSANKLADVARNTQESIDLMDSWSALAGAIREHVYPIYDQQVAHASMPGFSLAQAGRKEGAAMQFRNGLEKRWAKAQQATDALQMSSGVPEHVGLSLPHTLYGKAVRAGERRGLIPSPQGKLATDARKAIGEISPDTVPEKVTQTATHQPPKYVQMKNGSWVQVTGVPKTEYTPRKTGRVPVKHGLRSKTPFIASDEERELEEQQ